jgi:hypothetical protein
MRLIGASMRVSYTGTVDGEQGIMAASHVYDKRVCELSEKAVEEGYYVTRARPHEGIRMVYQPKDELDFTFTELNRMWDFGTTTNAFETFVNNGANVATPVWAYDPSAILVGGIASADQLDEFDNGSYREYVWGMAGN